MTLEFPDAKACQILEAYARGERNFRGINLCGVYFANPDVNDFPTYDLSGANFSAGIFSGIFFGYANLRECNFTGALINGSSFRGAKMQNARLMRIFGEYVDFSEANLKSANLTQASLKHCTFSKSNLRKAMLAQADLSLSVLTYADFRGANLSRCIMYESLMDKANFKGAFEHQTVFGKSYYPGTIYPNGRVDEGYFRSEAEFRGELDSERTISLEAELLGLYREFYDSLIEDSKGDRCETDGCLRNRIIDSNLCKKHYFELIQRKECPFIE